MESNVAVISPYCYPGIKPSLLPNNLFFRKNKNKFTVSKKEILRVISEECNVNVEDILSKVRYREVVDARHRYYASLRLMYGFSYEHICKVSLKKNHTTILHGLKVFVDRYRQTQSYRELTDIIFKKLDIKYNGQKLNKTDISN